MKHMRARGTLGTVTQACTGDDESTLVLRTTINRFNS